MPDFNKLPTPEEVNFYHLASDKDSGPGALHHTLGLGPSQASPGNHNHDGRNSKRVELKNLQGEKIVYQPEGGTNGTQPTFSGAPLITGSYTKWGNMCHFSILVEFTNITSFGTGRYYLTLPHKAETAYIFRDGCLHQPFPAGPQYHVSAHVDADSNRLELYSSDKVSSGVQDVNFTSTFPATLTTAGRFHIAGTYEIKQ